MNRIPFFTLAIFLFCTGSNLAWGQDKLSSQAAEFFETRIRPVLAEHCFSCHGPQKQRAGLRLDSQDHVRKGSDSGPIVDLKNPENSLLLRAVRHEDDLKMPPKGKLPVQIVEDLQAWVKMGAPWPEKEPGKITSSQGSDDSWKKHWAFQPVRQPVLPAVKNPAWLANPLDAFILAELEKKSLKPNPPADPRTLLRRLTYDLIGLPPTVSEMEAFTKAFRVNPHGALESAVDRLLASPHYGERWARHWLDVARYADTKGYVFTEERRYAYAYTYRDYVIRSFNEDKPYDQFVLEQLAADRLFEKKQVDREALAAMGYLTLGRRFLNNSHDIIDDRIDVVCRGLLGLTVTCARCHDHKFDPVPTRDYYSLYGVFASSVEPKDLPLIGEPERTPAYLAFEKKLLDLEAEIEKYREDNKADLASGNRKARDELKALQKKVDGFKASSPVAPPRAMVLADSPNPARAQVFLRGNPNNRGAEVPRQFLVALSTEERKPFKEGSGRLELARAIASPDNPLTARVLVNRVWGHYFGSGLVHTPSDFGVRSDPPSHPELLDYLARRFMDEAWSLKKLHRLIVLSNTYRQASTDQALGRKLDPENRLLWRAPRRRLDFESLRDSLLAVAGNLDPAVGGKAVDLWKEPFPARRSVYGFLDRQNLPGVFRTFDFPNPDAHTPQRYLTTVPQQALFLLNHPFVQEQARRLIQQPDMAKENDATARIHILYRDIYGRNPNDAEIRLGLAFIQGSAPMSSWEPYAQALLLANEFIFVD